MPMIVCLRLRNAIRAVPGSLKITKSKSTLTADHTAAGQGGMQHLLSENESNTVYRNEDFNKACHEPSRPKDEHEKGGQANINRTFSYRPKNQFYQQNTQFPEGQLKIHGVIHRVVVSLPPRPVFAMIKDHFRTAIKKPDAGHKQQPSPVRSTGTFTYTKKNMSPCIAVTERD